LNIYLYLYLLFIYYLFIFSNWAQLFIVHSQLIMSSEFITFLFTTLLLLLLVVPQSVIGTFSPTFRQFLRGKYGDPTDVELSREDVGGGGSFGGGAHTAGQTTGFYTNNIPPKWCRNHQILAHLIAIVPWSWCMALRIMQACLAPYSNISW
jgi:hypothetical protein